MIQPQLFDTIELLVDLPEYQLRAGAVGAIVELYHNDEFEIEFLNDYGETEQLCTLSTHQFIVVWQHTTGKPVSVADRMVQLAARLAETEQQEVLDYAHFLFIRRQQSTVSQSISLRP